MIFRAGKSCSACQTLHGQLAEQAEREGTSLNQFLLYVITSNVSAQIVASTVADKLMAAAPNVGLRPFSPAKHVAGLAALAAASPTMSCLAMTDHMAVIQETARAGAQIFAGRLTDHFEVFTYGEKPTSQRASSIREKGFAPVKHGRVRVHG